MKIDSVVCSGGRSGYFHIDFAAVKAGAVADGFIYRGNPETPGFVNIVEPADAVSIMLILEDGQVAFGDCCDVVFAGVSGRDPLFRSSEGLIQLEGAVTDRLCGQPLSEFRRLAKEFDDFALGGQQLPVALRYGLTQAILHAVSLNHKETMAEVLAREYQTSVSTSPIAISVSCEPHNTLQLDRMILKRPEILPHTYFTDIESEIGWNGEKLLEHIREISSRVAAIGGESYRPTLHFDFYGLLGDMFAQDIGMVSALIGRAAEAAGSLQLLVETPVLERTREGQIERMKTLRRELQISGINVGIIADDWCNNLSDIRAFCDEKAADYIQIKMPDLGGINNSMEAVLYCKQHGVGAFLGGSANETDQSARISVHVALASKPDFIGSKPGLSGDEALMMQTNEMARTLELIRKRRRAALAA
ncbi:methylaspartate ammonia-lyase [Mesorhizobium tianshanense]|uniref:methylaspartate ammonia-lyase n=1 Tax=Mesorhizobium tianshanense TaxID=39844 RepID=A0A562MI21_9HYPH|nr:methylaspartate ammonia-lyase [Mesorhizobium tianshanense]TWI19181.1 methylaspartate ammonia-lyase [Mesorhizobium tianshanense]GLS36551.1 methylaspartate ammonia-lyase [Mesorhizobium tianshanense]